MDEYKSSEVDVTLAQGLQAIVPKAILSNARYLNQLSDAFGNSLQTMQYYLQHQDKLQTELDLDPQVFRKFFTWISNQENLSDVLEFFKLTNVNVIKSEKKFEGAPIFRDKTIMLTGNFIHGSLDEVSSIFKSYAAATTLELSDSVDCVVIGDTQENIDGHAIIEARKRRVPIMTESEFFKQYDIEADMAENL